MHPLRMTLISSIISDVRRSLQSVTVGPLGSLPRNLWPWPAAQTKILQRQTRCDVEQVQHLANRQEDVLWKEPSLVITSILWKYTAKISTRCIPNYPSKQRRYLHFKKAEIFPLTLPISLRYTSIPTSTNYFSFLFLLSQIAI